MFRFASVRMALLLGCLMLPGAGTSGPAAPEATIAVAAQSKAPAFLTLERIFASGDLQPASYGPVRWLPKLGGYAIREASTTMPGAQDLVRVDPATGKREVLVSAAHLIAKGNARPLAIEDFHFSRDEARVLIYTNSQRVWRKNTRGDYWVFDINSRDLHQLGGKAAPATLQFASFSPNGASVAFVLDCNLFVEDLATHAICQLTQTESPHIINGTFDWVYEEEFHLYEGYRWSPDSSMLAFWQLDTKGVDDYYLVNNVGGLYQQLTKFKYPKVGRPNAACSIGVVRVDGKPLADSYKTLWLPLEGDAREHYIPWMDWADNSTEILVQQLNRLQNVNTVLMASIASGKIRTVLVEKDKAWLDVYPQLHWLDGGKKFTWISERDGWKHIYAIDRKDGAAKLLTPGNFDILGIVGVDEKNGCLYCTASPDNPTQKYLYRVPLDGSKVQRLSPPDAKGTHDYQISPHAGYAIHTFSTLETPPAIDLIALPEHKVVRMLVDNAKVRDKVQALKHQPAEFFRVAIGDGVELDGWCMKPADFDASKRYPVLFHVYGEPAGQTVLDRWGGSTYLWHLYLTQKGYVVVSVDNRGTPAPRGRDWRKVVYRQVGILAPQEQAAAVKALLERWSFADPGRIGIWGWSGGGSMSLDAIFRYPDLYHTAMAVAPVGNQRYYDTIYQERYMGSPEDNVAGYRDGSPITHAHKLKGHLLLVHGTGDDNVHYANTEAVIDELIAHNKQFAMMAYPNRSHSIQEGPNTRLHLFTLLTRYLQEHLPPGPRTK